MQDGAGAAVQCETGLDDTNYDGWQDAWLASANDPWLFVTRCMGYLPYDAPNPNGQRQLEKWQDKFLKEFYLDPNGRQTDSPRHSVRSGHGCGKSAVIALLAIWFPLTHYDSKTVITANSQDQLKTNNWPEVKKQSKYLPKPLLDQLQIDEERMYVKSSPEMAFVVRRTASKSNPEALAGIHAKHVLYLIDEASGIDDIIFETAQGSLSTPGACACMFSNPTRVSGFFYKTHYHLSDFWRCSQVSSRDVPRARGHIETIERAYGKNSNKVKVRVDGEFPTQDDDTVIPLEWVRSAVDREVAQLDYLPVWGVDVARFGCFDDKTEILTDQGWKLFSGLTGFEKVLTLVGDISEWAAIDEIHSYDFDGELNVHESPKLNFAITDNHKLLVRGRYDTSYMLRRYDELPQNFIMRKWNRWNGMSFDPVFETVKPMPNGGEAVYRWEFEPGDWAEFLGWFISEGNVYEEKRENGRLRILIAQNPGKKQDRIIALLEKMGITARVTPTGKQLEFTSQAIGQHLLDEVGHGAHNKRLPKYLKEATEPIIERFLEAYRLGDGTCRSDGLGKVYFSTSKQLLDDVQELLCKLGRAGLLTKRMLAGSTFELEGRTVERLHDTWALYERSGAGRKIGQLADGYVSKGKVKKVPYKGKVWCVSTRYKTIMVRRNGVPMWSGNSDRSAIAKRQANRLLEPVQTFHGLDTMQLSGVIFKQYHQEHEDRRPKEILIDVVGLGAGVVDRCRELGLPARGVNVAESNSIDDRCMRLRDALWFQARDWFEARDCSIPNDTTLISELVVPTYDQHSSGRNVVESKKDLKVRVPEMGSPDAADAFCLTFAGSQYRKMPIRRGPPVRRNPWAA